MWLNMVERVKNREAYPEYQNVELRLSRQEFITWVIPQLEKWKYPLVGSKNSPSVDRINNNGHYEIENLQLLTKSEHCSKKVRITPPNGTSWCVKCERFLPLVEFHKSSARFFGVKPRCKKCRSKA